MMNTGQKPSNDRLKRVRARHCRGGGELEHDESPSLRLYGEIVFKERRDKEPQVGQTIKMTNVVARSKVNYIQPIEFTDETKKKFPCLVLTVEQYVQQGSMSIFTNSHILKEVSVASVLCVCHLSYDANARALMADICLQKALEVNTVQSNRNASSVASTATAQAVDCGSSVDGRVVLLTEPPPGSRSKRVRRAIVHDCT